MLIKNLFCLLVLALFLSCQKTIDIEGVKTNNHIIHFKNSTQALEEIENVKNKDGKDIFVVFTKDFKDQRMDQIKLFDVDNKVHFLGGCGFFINVNNPYESCNGTTAILGQTNEVDRLFNISRVKHFSLKGFHIKNYGQVLVADESGNVYLERIDFINNTIDDAVGGGILKIGRVESLSIKDSNFKDNSFIRTPGIVSSPSGVVFIDKANSLSLENLNFTNNFVQGNGKDAALIFWIKVNDKNAQNIKFSLLGKNIFRPNQVYGSKKYFDEIIVIPKIIYDNEAYLHYENIESKNLKFLVKKG